MNVAATTLLLAALTASAARPQRSPVAADASASPCDVIELRSGGRIAGSIVRETAGYVELRITPGSVVGVEKKRVLRILRGTQPNPATRRTVLRPRDQWFVLHDALGRAVGKLHSTVAADAEGHLRLSEEWAFEHDHKSTEVTRLEVVTADLRPVSCFYHERIRVADGRTVAERLLRGTVDGDRLVVESRTSRGHERTHYPWREGMHFPMAVVELLRQARRSATEPATLDVYDVERGAFVRRTFTPGRRVRTHWRGEDIEVTEIHHGGQRQRNTEWVDASARVLRREINGPGLVAVSTSEGLAGHYVRAAEPIFAPSILAEPTGRFGLWLPDPSWSAGPTREGAVWAEAPEHGATVFLVAFDHIAPEVLPASAADAVARWARASWPSFEVQSRGVARVRDVDGVLLEATCTAAVQGRERRCRAQVFVVRVDGKVLALGCVAPRRQWPDLAPYFDRIRSTVELRAAGVPRAPEREQR